MVNIFNNSCSEPWPFLCWALQNKENLHTKACTVNKFISYTIFVFWEHSWRIATKAAHPLVCVTIHATSLQLCGIVILLLTFCIFILVIWQIPKFPTSTVHKLSHRSITECSIFYFFPAKKRAFSIWSKFQCSRLYMHEQMKLYCQLWYNAPDNPYITLTFFIYIKHNKEIQFLSFGYIPMHKISERWIVRWPLHTLIKLSPKKTSLDACPLVFWHSGSDHLHQGRQF